MHAIYPRRRGTTPEETGTDDTDVTGINRPPIPLVPQFPHPYNVLLVMQDKGVGCPALKSRHI